jgi:hypothetical protein
MRNPITLLACSILLIVTPISQLGAAQPGTVSILDYVPSDTPWGHGSLSIVLKANGQVALGMDFMETGRKLSSLILKGKGWNVVLTPIVSELPDPYPLRTQAYVKKAYGDGNVEIVEIAIPFGDADTCKAMSIIVEDGKVLKSEVAAATDSQCEP